MTRDYRSPTPPRVPERADIAHFANGIVWRRNREHETFVLKVRRDLCVGEGWRAA